MPLDAKYQNATAGAPPLRRAMSLRRTSSIQSFWPAGAEQPAAMAGRGRDLFTNDAPEAGAILASDTFDARLDSNNLLLSIEGSRRRDVLTGFAGLSPGGPMRKAMAGPLADEADRCTILHRLLDDMAGASFIAKSAWYDWPGGLTGYHGESGAPSGFERSVEGVCLSHVAGSEALTADGKTNDAAADHPFAPPPVSDGDPLAWHVFAPTTGPNQWRLRRTDLWLEDDELAVDAWFQDSAVVPGRTDVRRIFHEYSIAARFERGTLILRTIEVEGRVLPFGTCFAAPQTARALLGKTPDHFRAEVVQSLRGVAGCTHLNDMLRALQDVSGLARTLETALSG